MRSYEVSPMTDPDNGEVIYVVYDEVQSIMAFPASHFGDDADAARNAANRFVAKMVLNGESGEPEDEGSCEEDWDAAAAYFGWDEV